MNQILAAFQDKIKRNALTEADFTQASIFEMFRDKAQDPFIRKIADCRDPIFEKGEDKFIYHIPLGDGWEVRLDFILENGAYRLSDLDSFTIPLRSIDKLPFSDFEPLPEFEGRMREEYRITKMVNDYRRLKEIIGKQDALDWFKDGQGEMKGIPAWMPYFTKRKAFIAYSAWMQSRIYSEDIRITEFTEERSELLFHSSIWLNLYKVAGHLKQMISFEEYLELFETIWRDRAFWNGYQADFEWTERDIRSEFTAI